MQLIVVNTTNMEKKPVIEDAFGKLVYQTERLLVIRLQRNFKLSGHRITAEQWRVLINLWHKDGQTQQELAEKAFKDKGNTTRLINSLEDSNIVVRIPNHADRRSNLIYLTSKGKTYLNALIPIAQKTLEEAQIDIPQEEMELCKSVLNRVILNLGK